MQYCEKCMKPLPLGGVCSDCGRLPPVPSDHLKPGTLLAQRYLIGRAYEQTRRAVTYMARDLEQDCVVAVQEYFPVGRVERDNSISNEIHGMQMESRALSRFEEKAKALCAFADEPCIASVMGVLRENNTVYAVMERPSGITMQTYLKKKGPVPAQTLLELMQPLLFALHRLHEKSIIHRRISPESIRLYPDGTIKLVDFGTAGESLEKTGLKHGYAAMEQYDLRGHVGPWSDIYALCATIYKSITGVTPPTAPERAAGDLLPEPSRFGAVLTEAQQQALTQGLAVQADQRLHSMEALLSVLGIELPRVEEELPVEEIPEEAPAEETAQDEAPKEETVQEETPVEAAEQEKIPTEETVQEEELQENVQLELPLEEAAEEDETSAEDISVGQPEEPAQEQAEEAPAEETPVEEEDDMSWAREEDLLSTEEYLEMLMAGIEDEETEQAEENDCELPPVVMEELQLEEDEDEKDGDEPRKLSIGFMAAIAAAVVIVGILCGVFLLRSKEPDRPEIDYDWRDSSDQSEDNDGWISLPTME